MCTKPVLNKFLGTPSTVTKNMISSKLQFVVTKQYLNFQFFAICLRLWAKRRSMKYYSETIIVNVVAITLQCFSY